MTTYILFNEYPDFELLASSTEKFSFIGYKHSSLPLFMLRMFKPKFKMGKFNAFPMTVCLACKNEASEELAANVESLAETLKSPSIESFSVQMRTCAALSEMLEQPTYFIDSNDYVDSACFAKNGQIVAFGIKQGYDSEKQKSCVMFSGKNKKMRCAVLEFEGDSGTLKRLEKEHAWCNPVKPTKADSRKAQTGSYWPDSLWPSIFGDVDLVSPVNEIDVYECEIVRFDAKGRKPKLSYKRKKRS